MGEGNKLSSNTLNYHLKELEEKDEGERDRKGRKKHLEFVLQWLKPVLARTRKRLRRERMKRRNHKGNSGEEKAWQTYQVFLKKIINVCLCM